MTTVLFNTIEAWKLPENPPMMPAGVGKVTWLTFITSSNCAPATATGEGNVTVYGGVPAIFRIPPNTLVGTVMGPVAVTTFPLKLGTLTVTLLSCRASATFVPANIDLRTLLLSSGVAVALAKSVSCFVDKSVSSA